MHGPADEKQNWAWTLINNTPRVVVIGGGATGCGVARDLILRGFGVTLVEGGDLGSGTSSRFHGMLQSGARYAVSDTEYAAECMRERLIIADLVPQAVEKTGGLFVSLPDDPEDYGEKFLNGCIEAKIPITEVDVKQILREEPAISRNVLRSFSVPDATMQPWQLLNLLAKDMRFRGVEVLLRHQVTAIRTSNGRVDGVLVSGKTGTRVLEADIVVNAAGPWTAQVAGLVGETIDIELGKGSIIVFSYRMVTRAINRCRPPTSHDIIVPTGTVSLFGTTSEIVNDPSTTDVHPEEIQQLLDNAETLIPNARSYRVFRAWAGVRPLYRPPNWSSDKPLSRRHSIVNHATSGIEGLFSICGGSWTSHRSMSEDLGNQVCQSIGLYIPCSSATTPLSENPARSTWKPQNHLHDIERKRDYLEPVCECELVKRSDIRNLIENHNVTRLHDMRRRLRVGFGPCQGTYCGSRVASMIAHHHPGYCGKNDLKNFWAERLKGIMHTAWGDQARQALLSDVVYRETLGIRLDSELLPAENEA